MIMRPARRAIASRQMRSDPRARGSHTRHTGPLLPLDAAEQSLINLTDSSWRLELVGVGVDPLFDQLVRRVRAAFSSGSSIFDSPSTITAAFPAS